MFNIINIRFFKTFVISILIIWLLFQSKPGVFFTPDGRVKDFNYNYSDNSTPFPLLFFIIFFVGIVHMSELLGGKSF